MEEVEECSGGRVRVGPGTLYEALQSLEKKNLVADTGHVRVGEDYIAIEPTGEFTSEEQFVAGFPDRLTFHDAPTVIEQRLFEMHLKHRMRAFQGTFHANPDYALWYGWSEMVRDLTDIREKAAELRSRHRERTD